MNKIGETAVCERCGKEYIRTAGQQKYCKDCVPVINREMTREYQRAFRARNRKAVPATRICVVCGKEFPQKANMLTCSEECRKARIRQKVEERKEMKIGDIYEVALATLRDHEDRDSYIAEVCKAWGDGKQTPERIEWAGNIWDKCHLDVKGIAKEAGLTQRGLARRFAMPYRTVDSWCSGVNSCLLHIRIMMLECLGMISPVVPD